MADTIKKWCNVCDCEFDGICDGRSICDECEAEKEDILNSTDK